MDDQVASANRSVGSRVRLGLQIFGELLITVGVLCVLFTAYQLWWTNVVAHRQTVAAQAQADRIIDAPTGPVGWTRGIPPHGTPFALLYIPRLRDHVWGLPVIQGIGTRQLAEGVGHYPRTAMPGQVGNFAIAGHRATHGEPFAEFDRLRDGDEVYLKTRDAWYAYRLDRDQLIAPIESWVINPRPFPTDTNRNNRLITLTTCNPRWASLQRWAYWGRLVESKKRSAGLPAGLEL